MRYRDRGHLFESDPPELCRCQSTTVLESAACHGVLCDPLCAEETLWRCVKDAKIRDSFSTLALQVLSPLLFLATRRQVLGNDEVVSVSSPADDGRVSCEGTFGTGVLYQGLTTSHL